MSSTTRTTGTSSERRHDGRLAPYRHVLARPGVRPLLVTTLLARVPVTAAPVVLTLHVVLDLHRGFGASGTVAALTMVGAALGAPFIGRNLDRFGLFPVLVVTTLAEAAFWAMAAWLSYAILLPAAFLLGLLALPVFTISRQSLAALVPPAERQAAFSLDSMSVELSYAIGPAVGVIVLTSAGSTVTLVGVATAMLVAGLALIMLNPPIRGEEGVAPEVGRAREKRKDVADEPLPSIRSWLGPRVAAVLVATSGATLTLSGTGVAITAAMRSFHEIALIGVVILAWSGSSLVGGFVYGLRTKGVDPLVLLVLLAALTLLAAAAPNWWLLALLVIPSGCFCAPLIASTAGALTDRTPANVRGQVMGLHASALTVGNGIGAPLVGFVVDRTSPRVGFVGIGLLGAALATLALLAIAVAVRRRSDVAAG